MRNVSVVFKLIPEGKRANNDYKYVGFHMIYDVKMDFTPKAWLGADGHRVPDPAVSTYASVVSCKIVRIALTYAALNDINIMTGDIGNAYLQAPTSDKYFTKLEPKFGSVYEGQLAYIVHAAYGLKEASTNFRNHLRDCMSHLGYTSSNADNDLWFRKAEGPHGIPYYEFLLLYVDDCLSMSHSPHESLLEVRKYFKLKPGLIDFPKTYLGGKVDEILLPYGVTAYTFSST